jgi:hypothetical protein
MNAISITELKIQKTSRTPEVIFDPAAGNFSIRGRSIPEDSVGFYQPLYNWLDRFGTQAPKEEKFTVEIELEYFNTSSSKCILDVFKRLNRLHHAGVRVEVVWLFDEDDEDLEEMGEDYRDLLDLPFVLKGVEY